MIIFLSGHNPFVAVGQQWFIFNPAGFERLFEMWVGDVLRSTWRNGRFDQSQTIRGHLPADYFKTGFKSADIRISASKVAQILFDKITLDIDHKNIRQFQGIVRVGGDHGFFLVDAAFDQHRHLRVFGFNRRDTPVEQWYFPKTPCARSLHADDKFPRLSGFFVRRIGNNSRHDGTDKSQTHYDNDLKPLFAFFLNNPAESFILGLVVAFFGNLEFLTFRAD